MSVKSVLIVGGVAGGALALVGYFTKDAIKKAAGEVVTGAATIANAPLQAFRDPAADSDNIGTEAWTRKQLDSLKFWKEWEERDVLSVYNGAPALVTPEDEKVLERIAGL